MAVNQPEQSARSYFILLVVAGITLSGIVLQSWKVQNAQAANAEDGQHDEEETSEVPPDVAFVNELHHADDDLPEEDKRQYDVARQYLFDVDQSRRFDAETRRKLSDVERKADKVLAAIREKELSQYQGHNDFPPANSFYEGVHAIPKSDVFRILKKMPKGGALHIHASSFGDADTLVNLATLEECLVEVLKDTEEAVELSGRIALQSKQDSVPEN